MAATEIKTMLQSVRKYPQQNSKTYKNQPINSPCKSIVWSPHNTSLHQRYLQADHNGTFQDIKRKTENRQLEQSRIRNTSKNFRQHPFLKNNKPLKPVCRKLHPKCSSEYAPGIFEIFTRFFQSFSENQMKGNRGKCHYQI